MAPVCHGVCHRYKPNWLGMAAGSVRYSSTTCRCTTCRCWLIIETGTTNNRCNCCNILVKRSRHGKTHKERMLVCKIE